MAKIRIKLIKSGIGYSMRQKRVLKALGLKRLNQFIDHDDSAVLRGMINKVRHLVFIKEV
jgi:large subunit ribosomal protein L30